MEKDLTNTKILANELLMEKYKPVMVIKLSKNTTLRLISRLKEFAMDIREKTHYEVLIFPDEEKTEVEIVSICKSEYQEIESIKNYIYKKYETEDLSNVPYTRIIDKLKEKNNE
tara:strand:+ start:307 stop:648 length:342 start_codon:yes stop_codon:yes gene_type:complete